MAERQKSEEEQPTVVFSVRMPRRLLNRLDREVVIQNAIMDEVQNIEAQEAARLRKALDAGTIGPEDAALLRRFEETAKKRHTRNSVIVGLLEDALNLL